MAAAPVPEMEPDWPPMPADEDEPKLLPEGDVLPDADMLPPKAVLSHLYVDHLASLLFRPLHFGFELWAAFSAIEDDAPDDPAMLPLLVSIELLALLSCALLVVEPAVLALWLAVAPVLALSFLCFMSPIANAELLAMAMIDVTTNAGASLRILPPIGL